MLVSIALLALHATPPCPTVQQDPAPQERFIRLAEGDDRLAVELAVRSYRPTDEHGAPTGPWVHLVSAMHVADGAYFAAVQAFLDGRDVVLYERVEPARADTDRLAGMSAVARCRVRATQRRMARLAAHVERYRTAHDRYPQSLPDARTSVGSASSARFETWLRDAWGNALVYAASDDTFALGSLGADGREGGEGEAHDLTFAPGPAGLQGDERGMQGTIADALGLVFQLDAIDYTGARWRNSDMTMEELQAALSAEGVEVETFLSSLTGGSLVSKIAGGVLKFIGSTRTGAGMLKIVGLEVLSRADEILGALPPDMAALFEVLIERRNAVVVRDLTALLEHEPEVETIAIFYGAAHMASLARSLTEELGLVQVREHWIPAMQVRIADTGMSASDVKMMRRMIRNSVNNSLKTMRGR